MAAKNYTLNSYTNDTWTDLVTEAAILTAIVIANTDAATTVTFEIRLDDGAGTELSRILPPSTIDPNVSQTLDVRSFVVGSGQRLQVTADAAGLHFTASGDA